MISKWIGTTEVKGVFNVDIVVRYALIKALEDLRQNPWQLQLVFASLLDDPFTQDIYGAKEVQKAISWFLKTNVPVIMDYDLNSSPNMPIITVGIKDGAEAESTLSDTHYVPTDSMEADWEPITQKVTVGYNPATGLVTTSDIVIVNNQMIFVTGDGIQFPVLDVSDEGFFIATGIVGNFNNCYLKWANKKLGVQLGSVNCKDTVVVGCHVLGEANYLLYLGNIVQYLLFKYKQTLLEGRGYERTTISWSAIVRNSSLAPPGTENAYSKFFTVTGYSKTYFAQTIGERIGGAEFDSGPDALKFSSVGRIATSFKAPEEQEDPSWLAQDGIGLAVE